MFEKFKNEDTDPEVPAAPEPEVKKFAQEVFVEVAKAAPSVDDESFVAQVIQNPDSPAELEIVIAKHLTVYISNWTRLDFTTQLLGMKIVKF